MNQLQMINRMLWGGGDPNLLLQLLGNTTGNTTSKWIDTSIYGNNAIQSNVNYQPSLTNNVFGTNNYGYVFNKTQSDFMEIVDNDIYSFTDDTNDLPFTIKFKTKFITNTGLQWFVSKRGASIGEWQIAFSNGNMQLTLFDNTISNYIFAYKSFTPILSTIYELKFTYDGSGSNNGIRIWINNIEQTSLTYGNVGTFVKMRNTSIPISIASMYSINNTLNGALTDIEIWKGVI